LNFNILNLAFVTPEEKVESAVPANPSQSLRCGGLDVVVPVVIQRLSQDGHRSRIPDFTQGFASRTPDICVTGANRFQQGRDGPRISEACQGICRGAREF
jgi:hypothetical protein